MAAGDPGREPVANATPSADADIERLIALAAAFVAGGPGQSKRYLASELQAGRKMLEKLQKGDRDVPFDVVVRALWFGKQRLTNVTVTEPAVAAVVDAAAARAELATLVAALTTLTDKAVERLGQRALEAADPKRSKPEREHAQLLLIAQIRQQLRGQQGSGM